MEDVFPSAATLLAIIHFLQNAGYSPVSDKISNLLIRPKLLTLAASAGSRSAWAGTLKTWGIRHAGCDQDTNVAEMPRKALLELIQKRSVSVLQRDGSDR